MLDLEIKEKSAKLKEDALKFVQELNDLFQNPKGKFPQVKARLEDDAQNFVEDLGKALRDPKSVVKPDNSCKRSWRGRRGTGIFGRQNAQHCSPHNYGSVSMRI